jgi:hypothetical protein
MQLSDACMAKMSPALKIKKRLHGHGVLAAREWAPAPSRLAVRGRLGWAGPRRTWRVRTGEP